MLASGLMHQELGTPDDLRQLVKHQRVHGSRSISYAVADLRILNLCGLGDRTARGLFLSTRTKNQSLLAARGIGYHKGAQGSATDTPPWPWRERSAALRKEAPRALAACHIGLPGPGWTASGSLCASS